MSLNNIDDSRVEDLAEKALAELAADGRGPFEKSCVIVSNPLRAQWLKRCALLDGMAGSRQILANVDFLTLDRFVAGAVKKLEPDQTTAVIDAETLALRIYVLLTDAQFMSDERMKEPRAYLMRGDKIDHSRAGALAREIGSLFQKYQIHRPGLLEVWKRQAVQKDDPSDVAWQMALWNRIARDMTERGEKTLGEEISRITNPKAEKHENLVKLARQGYRTVIAFDLPTLPVLYSDLLRVLGEQGSVTVYKSKDTANSKDAATASGCDFVPDDKVSLELHGCYTPRRELEAVRNGLYDWFNGGQKRDDKGSPTGASSRRPRTALVLCADFAKYAPAIEAVFGPDAEKGEIRLTGEGTAIPLKVAGHVAAGGGDLVATFETLLGMTESRFACSELMNILEQPAVFARFGFDDSDRRFVRTMIQGANIRWGYNDEHVRAILGLEENSDRIFPFTWRRGVDRLLLGALEGPLGDDTFGVVDVGSMKSVKPNERIHGEQARRAARIDRFLEAVNRIRVEFSKPRTVEAWSEGLHGIVDDFFLGRDEHSVRAIAGMHRAIDAVTHRLRDFPGKDAAAVYYGEALREMLGPELQAISLEEFRKRTVANAVIFAPLSIGAAFPCDMIWVCGLNNASFPRKACSRAFDRMAASPETGDPSARIDDRIAFGEAVRCARSRLVLSYQSRDAKTNKEFPPSVFVEELKDHIQSIPFVQHPLHGFNAKYFTGESGLSSWSGEDYAAALAARNPGADDAPAKEVHAFAIPEEGTTSENPVEIDLDDLCGYCNNPERFILRNVLNAIETGAENVVFQDDEEFFRGKLDLGALKGQWSVQDEVAGLAKCEGLMDEGRLLSFVQSLREEGLLADDYEAKSAMDSLGDVWASGEKLRNQSQDQLNGLTPLQALVKQSREPDYIEVKTEVAKLCGLYEDRECEVHYRIVGRIPVVPGTKIHLEEALTGNLKPWDKMRLTVYGTLAQKFGIAVQLYEVHPAPVPLVESAIEALDLETQLRTGFGIEAKPEENQEG